MINLLKIWQKKPKENSSPVNSWLDEYKGKKIIIKGGFVEFSGVIEDVRDAGTSFECLFETGDIFYLSKVCSISPKGVASVMGSKKEDKRKILYMELSIASWRPPFFKVVFWKIIFWCKCQYIYWNYWVNLYKS